MPNQISVKLFGKTIAIQLTEKGSGNIYSLAKPITISKKNILAGLGKVTKVPASVSQYLPDSITLNKLVLNKSVNPTSTDFAMEIDYDALFQQFQNIIALKQGGIDIQTNAPVTKQTSK